MTIETLLFPVGPMDIDGDALVGVLITVPGQDVTAVWAHTWEDVFDQAINHIESDDWITVKWMEELLVCAKGRGRNMRPDHAIRLSRLVGDLYDHAGFAELTSDMNAFALMKAMAGYISAVTQMTDGRSQPVVIDIKDSEAHSMFVAGMGRKADTGYLYVTQTSEMLVKLIETSFGIDLPDWVGFIMAQVEPGQGWIGQATHDLFGVSFQPMIRARTTAGVICPVSEDRIQFLIVSLFRAVDIAGGHDSAKGKVALHDWAPDVEMWRFDP